MHFFPWQKQLDPFRWLSTKGKIRGHIKLTEPVSEIIFWTSGVDSFSVLRSNVIGGEPGVLGVHTDCPFARTVTRYNIPRNIQQPVCLQLAHILTFSLRSLQLGLFTYMSVVTNCRKWWLFRGEKEIIRWFLTVSNLWCAFHAETFLYP